MGTGHNTTGARAFVEIANVFKAGAYIYRCHYIGCMIKRIQILNHSCQDHFTTNSCFRHVRLESDPHINHLVCKFYRTVATTDLGRTIRLTNARVVTKVLDQDDPVDFIAVFACLNVYRVSSSCWHFEVNSFFTATTSIAT